MMGDVWDRYRKMCGKMDIVVDGQTFTILAKLSDKLAFIELKEKLEKNQIQMAELFKWGSEILHRSYPDVPIEVQEELLKQNSREFFDEVAIGFGFFTKNDVKRLYEDGIVKKNPNDEG